MPGPKLKLLLAVTGENSSSASNAPAALPLLLFICLSRASSRSRASSSSSRSPVKLVELALETSQDCPFDSRAVLDISAPARSNQSESFLSFELSCASSRATLRRNFEPGVTDRGWPWRDRPTTRCVLDLLLEIECSLGVSSDTLERDLDSTDGVVGADRPSRYDR